MKLPRFVAWFDLHYGIEWKDHKGRRVLVKTHDEPSVRAALKFLKDFRPDVFIFGGDNLNMAFVSRHDLGRPRVLESFRGKQDYDGFQREILGPVEAALASGARKVWMYGNHEAWIQQYLNQVPALEGLIEPEDYLKLRERGWQIVSQGEIYKLGKLRFVHGDILLQGGGVFPAKKAIETYGKSIRLGHVHTYQVYARRVLAEEGFSTALCVPALSVRNHDYAKNRPANTMQGFLFGYVMPDGNFSDYVAVIYKGKFVWNGKVYDGTIR
jgi:hypothetical protein